MKVKQLLEFLGVEADTTNYPEDEFELVITTPKFTLPITNARINHETKQLELSP